MGLEAYPFLKRVEVRGRTRIGRSVYRDAFFEGSHLKIVRCGIGPNRAKESIRNLTVRPSVIISAGTAGSLVDGVRVGELIISSSTVSAEHPQNEVTASPGLVRALQDACCKEGLPHRVSRVVTSGTPVFNRDDRLNLGRATEAEAVDMESHLIGEEAARLGVPFAVLRVISDDTASPPLPDVRSLREIFGHPTKVAENLMAVRRWWMFMANLRRSVELLHPVLVRLIRSGIPK